MMVFRFGSRDAFGNGGDPWRRVSDWRTPVENRRYDVWKRRAVGTTHGRLNSPGEIAITEIAIALPVQGGWIRGVAESCMLSIRAVPNAPRNQIVGWIGDELKVKVHAPPVEGRANEELCEFLSETLALPRRAVRLVRGDKSNRKVVRIEGLRLPGVRARLGADPTSLKTRGHPGSG